MAHGTTRNSDQVLDTAGDSQNTPTPNDVLVPVKRQTTRYYYFWSMMSPAKALINFVPDKLCMHSSHQLRAKGVSEQTLMSAKILYFKTTNTYPDQRMISREHTIHNIYFVSTAWNKIRVFEDK